MIEAINIIDDGAVHLYGICQGGALAAIFATHYPSYVKELTVVAAPIDSSFESIITPAIKIPMFVYRAIVAANFGVMPGWQLLKAWWDQNKAHHEVEQKKPENANFYKKYKETQTISGAWYLWWVENVLKKRLVESLNITCKTNAIYGLNDNITTPGQILALQECCDSEVNFYTVNKGHMGAFASEEALKPGGAWSTIFKGGK
jgi:poly(3-hydroxyalkanoate) synthetase